MFDGGKRADELFRPPVERLRVSFISPKSAEHSGKEIFIDMQGRL